MPTQWFFIEGMQTDKQPTVLTWSLKTWANRARPHWQQVRGWVLSLFWSWSWMQSGSGVLVTSPTEKKIMCRQNSNKVHMPGEGEQQKNKEERGNKTKVECWTQMEGRWIELGWVDCCSLQGSWGSVDLINSVVYDPSYGLYSATPNHQCATRVFFTLCNQDKNNVMAPQLQLCQHVHVCMCNGNIHVPFSSGS